MISTLAVANYRSLLNLVLPLQPLTVITGPNGSGKSNLYRSLRLLADTAGGGVTASLAREGGLQSSFWAGPETLSMRMRSGAVPIHGGPRRHTVRLRLGFASDVFSYAIDLGLPTPTRSLFSMDPQIKREVIWNGPYYRLASVLVERRGPLVRARDGKHWRTLSEHLSPFDSLFSQIADPVRAPEVLTLREHIRSWRFYDQFRTDSDAPARQSRIGTRTPVLAADGSDLAAAIETIREIGDRRALENTIDDAFPGASVVIDVGHDGRFRLALRQPGLLRPLDISELSDGTLRFLLWVAALLTPRPPPLMVLNEPETSLHPDLLPALARLIVRASEHSQLWIVSHAARLIHAIDEAAPCHSIELDKELGQTRAQGLRELDEPAWHWPSR